MAELHGRRRPARKLTRAGPGPPRSHQDPIAIGARSWPSAGSGGIVGNGEMGFALAAEGGADAFDELAGRQQAGGLGDVALAVGPLGLDRVEPGGLARQVA